MRIDRLDLIKYGKFTNASLTFPATPLDFHLIVGPNEAGKSTLRSAILDLLFGIPARTALNFLHPHNELRLGATISAADGTALTFQRTKGLKNTLRTPQDAPLPEASLDTLLGGADRRFFDQMFGLDHPRLVQGGNDILNAENDIGQVLFQSAAGIASLGQVRDALEAEADELWAPKRSASRAYYAAATRLDEAKSALQQATVRTKEWTQAHEQAEQASQALATAGEQLAALNTTRTRLERVRRLAPYLRELREHEQRLAELGAVADLPADALSVLEHAEQVLALNRHTLALREQERSEAAQQRAAIVIDHDILARADEVEHLATLRVRHDRLPHELARCETDLVALQAQAARLFRELGWSDTDQQIPSLPQRRELDALVRNASTIAQTWQASLAELQSKQDELAALDSQLTQLGNGEVSASLRAALQQARSLGDDSAQANRLAAAVERAQLAWETSLQNLGCDASDYARLIAQPIPDATVTGQAAQAQREAQAELRTAKQRLAQLEHEADQAELAVTQYQALHQPVTPEALIQARSRRDQAWQHIKTGHTPVADAAPTFEPLLHDADRLADLRLDQADALAGLQARRHEAERSRLAVNAQRQQCQTLQADVERLEHAWQAHMTPLALSDMTPDAMLGWLKRFEQTQRDATTLATAQQEQARFLQDAEQAHQSLWQALRDEGLTLPDGESLAALILRADQHVKELDSARVRHDMLQTQRTATRTRLDTLTRQEQDARAAHSRWQSAWHNALTACTLPHSASPQTAQDALDLIAELDDSLRAATDLRTNRLDTLRAELTALQEQATNLASALAPDLSTQTPADISRQLSLRLEQARQAQATARQLDTVIATADAHIREANSAMTEARASVQPLLNRAGVDNHEQLRQAITLSDQQRTLAQAAEAGLSKLLVDGDGLDRSRIEQEVQQCDLASLPATLAQINEQLTQLQAQQNALSAEHAKAHTQLAAISGSDTAAQCEARRQESLAQMADAAERYIRVKTASRLLRWSIDRYREQKQGPMLTRAGELFAQLTQGSFERLSVDFDQSPMVLQGRRDDGRLVPISGMSDGTRDQLYLALRLAALELHLGHATALPLIADDLFINYDDARTRAGLSVLSQLSRQTQVIFLTHHESVALAVQDMLGADINVVSLDSSLST